MAIRNDNYYDFSILYTPEKHNECIFMLTYELYTKNRAKMLIKVIKSGQDVNIKDKYGNTPLHLACFYNNKYIAKILLYHGASNKIVNMDNKLPSDMNIYDDKLSNYIKNYKDTYYNRISYLLSSF